MTETEESYRPLIATLISETLMIPGLDPNADYTNRAHDPSLAPIKGPLQEIGAACKSLRECRTLETEIDKPMDSPSLSARQAFQIGDIVIETQLDIDTASGMGFRGTRIIPIRASLFDVEAVVEAVKQAYVHSQQERGEETPDLYIDTRDLTPDEELEFTEKYLL